MKAGHQPFMKWYPTDWRADPRLRMCSLAARGLWIELIGYMHEGEPYGHLTINGLSPAIEDVASLVGRPLGEVRKAMAELEQRQVYSVDEHGRMFSRRMVRDKAKAEANRENGHLGGNPDIPRGTVPKGQRARSYKRSDAPQKTLRIFERSNGHCVWCATELQFHPDGSANGFHVDHVIAVCDGGTNDESNLVAACADCNHKRARMDKVGRAGMVMVGKYPDHKAHIPEARDQRPERQDAPVGATTAYAFQDGIIRLNQRDFDSWTRAFSYLDLSAELMSLSKWAESEGKNWFHAVKGALAKRNREVKAAKEKPADSGPKWLDNIPGVL